MHALKVAAPVSRRLMDAVDPALVDKVEATLRRTPRVHDIGEVRLRWIGHQLRAECEITINDAATIVEAHMIAHDAEHRLIHAVPRLTAAVVYAEPDSADRDNHHELVTAHR